MHMGLYNPSTQKDHGHSYSNQLYACFLVSFSDLFSKISLQKSAYTHSFILPHQESLWVTENVSIVTLPAPTF